MMGQSKAEAFKSLPFAERARRLALLSDDEAAALAHDWNWFARPDQMLPDGDWLHWLILAGRGFGKTRTGAETVRQWNKQGFNYVNLIGATADDARDIMIEGESGLLAICAPDERPTYLAHKSQLRWPNGATSLIFTADAPERLRGKQHEKVWADELCAWRYDEAWDQAVFGLRLGKKPQTVITTTPKPSKLLKKLMSDPKTHITRGSTYANRANLAPDFVRELLKKYEGTRLGKQELDGLVLEDVQGALWHDATLENCRGMINLEQCSRIVIGVDPSGGGDEVGIVAAGDVGDGKYAVIDDASCESSSPDAWAKRIVALYHRLNADCVVVEVNFGGNMVQALLKRVDPSVNVREVRASRGKHIRAEPIAALYEQGRVMHNGLLTKLEEQMLSMSISGYVGDGSPDRLDAMVWALTCLTDVTTQPTIDMGALMRHGEF